MTFFQRRLSALWWLPTLFLLAPPVVVHAEDYLYTTNNGTITITKYTGPGGDVTITNSINGLPVDCIGAGAFSNCISLSSVTIPNSVTRIGDVAFLNCTNLPGITIPNSITSIGDMAFLNCGSLTNVTIGDSVTNIGHGTFYYCTSLVEISVNASNPVYGSIGGVLFDKNQTTLVQFPAGKTGPYTIPINVTDIGSEAFFLCTSLTGVTVPASVTNIPSPAFLRCTSLVEISVHASNSVYSSVDGVLFNKNQATLVQFPAGKTGPYTTPASLTSIGRDAFRYCTSLTNVTIGNSVTNIGGYLVFDNCTNLTSITIGKSVTSIGASAFSDCTSLTSVYFRGNAPNLGSFIFDGDSQATVYYLPGTTNWGSLFDGRPAVLWDPQAKNDATFGVGPSGFGFTITGPTNVPIVVQACTNLIESAWFALSTNTLTDGTSYFSDPQWTNDPARFYRFCAP